LRNVAPIFSSASDTDWLETPSEVANTPDAKDNNTGCNSVGNPAGTLVSELDVSSAMLVDG
jgi:hypothetical protein